jgi:hypothetical protein
MIGDNTPKLKVIELYHFIYEIAMGAFFFVGITPKLKTLIGSVLCRTHYSTVFC